MIFVVCLTLFFVSVFYSREYLKQAANKLSLRNKNITLIDKNKSINKNKMSDDEFCDPSGARKHWEKISDNPILHQSKKRSKRICSSDVPNVSKKNKKKPKTIEGIELTDDEPEFSDSSGASNCCKKNINIASHPNNTSVFRWKGTLSSDATQDDKKGPNINECVELSDDESEVSTSDDSVNKKPSLKNISSISDSPFLNTNNEEISSKKNNIDDPKNKHTKCLEKIKNFLKCDKKYDNFLLPPGMPPVIAGVPVRFPVTPYKSQISVMNAVIKGCKNKENCLLESPTGSGKTLALLCATLSWQTYFIKKWFEDMKVSQNHGTFESYLKEVTSSYFENSETKVNVPQIPKIFYGSRTHKQIEQIIGEFKRTTYSGIPMSILSSREHSCIQPFQKGVSKTQLCNDLLDPLTNGSCVFYPEKFRTIPGLQTPWDIEDLVEMGRKMKTCPYFAARDMMLEANIVFCPYNYLIDPSIREAMKIEIDGNVIIIDEAHNIEDTCRGVGSYSLREDFLGEAIENFKLVCNFNNDDKYKTAYEYLTTLDALIKGQYLQVSSNPREEAVSAFWTGEETWILLQMHKLGDQAYNHFVNDCKHIIEDYNLLKDEAKTTFDKNFKKYQQNNVINFTTKKLIEELQIALKYISCPEYNMSYRCCISESFHQDAKEKVSENTWISSHGGKRVREFKFLCMNAGVIFTELTKKARCVVLASGTLSPIVSFESELGTKFTHKLHANHVVTKDQVYVRTISHGPSGTVLRATYQNVQTLPFKDDLGNLIKEVCECMPHGVLCFFSSYTSMRSNIERWKDTDLWEELNQCKRIFVEPRQHSELEGIMNEYRDTVESDGALFFAVFRGKVAEGIDFSDNNARCVITIGIPFAVQNDPDVKLKREYNESNRSKGLLSGSEWYTVQAYRALNQALGRCIRHKNDWGAILLVDERLLSSQSFNLLPKWVREMKLEGSNYDLKQELIDFVKRQQ